MSYAVVKLYLRATFFKRKKKISMAENGEISAETRTGEACYRRYDDVIGVRHREKRRCFKKKIFFLRKTTVDSRESPARRVCVTLAT